MSIKETTKHWRNLARKISGERNDQADVADNSRIGNYLSKISYSTIEPSNEFSAETSFRKICFKIANEPQKLPDTIRYLKFKYISIAASVAILALSTFYVFVIEKSIGSREVTVFNSIGKIRKFELPDGSTVWLNASSRITYPAKFSSDKREVSLTGEAFFDVSKDAKRPFIVNTPKIKVRVLGTKFNVKSFAGEATVATLVEGKVSLEKEVKGIVQTKTIVPGQQVIISPRTGEMELKDNVDMKLCIAWKDKSLLFRQNTINDIAGVLEREFHVKIFIESSKLRKRKYTGEFEANTSLEKILQVINTTTPFSYKAKGDTLYLKDQLN